MDYYLGIDIGTFESKGVLVNEHGEIVATATRPHKMIVPQTGWAEHRAKEDWWDDFTAISRDLIVESHVSATDIKAVACSAIGPCMLPVDEQGEPLMNAVLYGVDGRSADQIVELTKDIGEQVLLDRCGNALTTQSIGPKILWLKQQRPELFKQTHKILTSTSFLVHRLTGNYVIDHFTAASFSPLYDADDQTWSTELCADLIDLDMLPTLAWSTDIAGTVTADAAQQSGLAEGTPVTVGTIDAAAEAVSVGVVDNGDMMLMYGSTMFLIMLHQNRLTDARLWYAPWLFPGQHAAMAGAATSGTLTHWFKDQLAKELGADAFEVLAAEAENSPPGAKGLVFLPYFSGERTPLHDPAARGVWFGLDLTHTRGDMYRALLEGIAMGTRQIIDTFAEVGRDPGRIMAVGGGTKNRVWSQATSDIIARPQLLSEKTIGASYGDAFLAAIAVDAVSIDDIKNWNSIDRSIEPQQHSAYDLHYQVFKKLYSSTAALMHKLAASG